MADDATTDTDTESTSNTDEQQTGPDLTAEVEKWKALARKNEQRAKANAEAADRLAALEEQDKTEVQKLTDKATAAETRAAAAEMAGLRLEVALDKAPEGMSVAQVRKLAKRLAGTTREDLEADADELFADFATDDDDSTNDPDPSRRPKEKLRGGRNVEDKVDDIDPLKLAAEIGPI